MVSKRIQEIVPSATEAFSAKVADLRKRGVDVVNFTIGEPDFDTPPHIIRAAKEAMDSGKNKYTAVAGILELREAICKKLSKENGISYKPGEIVVSAGAKNALGNAIMAICNPGDEVMLPTPCWVSYTEIIKLANAVPVLIPTEEVRNFGLDLDLIKKAITRKTRAIIINSPNNPTGAVYSQKALTALAELAMKHDFWVISDEIYEKMIYENARHFSIASLSPEMRQRCITINGFSKAYVMTGWRLGYSAAPEEISAGMESLQGHTITNAASMVQYAGIAALRGPQDVVEDMRRQYDERRQYLIGRLRSMPGIGCSEAEGAFYLFPNVSRYFSSSFAGKRITNSEEFCSFMLEQAHVAVIPGLAFEAPNNVRMSYATSMANIKEGMDRMEAALALLTTDSSVGTRVKEVGR